MSQVIEAISAFELSWPWIVHIVFIVALTIIALALIYCFGKKKKIEAVIHGVICYIS